MDASQLKEIETMCGKQNLELQAAMIDHLGEILSREPKKLAKIKNPLRLAGALARREIRQIYMPSGFVSFDDGGEGLALHETISAIDQEAPTAWRLVVMDDATEHLLDVLREEGTEGLASRLGVSRRRVQQKLVALIAQIGGGDDQQCLMGV